MLHFSMKNLARCLIAVLLTTAVACKKGNNSANEPISQDVLQQIYQMGFSTANVKRVPEGYVVEGDILLRAENFNKNVNTSVLRVAKQEQYRTNNLVGSLPRVISVSIDNNLPSQFAQALDTAIARYNALGLRLTFQRVSTNAQIQIVRATLNGPLGRSNGFPSGGQPASPIWIDDTAFDVFFTVQGIASVIAHEMGHCIGFRHTDYFDRSISGCLVDANNPANEGAGSDGAILIPGTYQIDGQVSWMLACTDGGDRPFTFYDRVALHSLYGGASPSCGAASDRLINGVCETGSRIITQQSYDQLHNRCILTYYYIWTNGEISGTMTSTETGPCH